MLKDQADQGSRKTQKERFLRSAAHSLITRLKKLTIQCCPFLMLCLVSIGMVYFISESCYKGSILQRSVLQRNHRKMTMEWSFSYNSFCKIPW